MRDVTSRSLAAVDELGRGTAPKEGAAIVGAVLEVREVFVWCMMWVELCSYCVAVQHTHPKAKGVTGTRADRQNVFLFLCVF